MGKITQKIELLFDLNKYTECIELCLKHFIQVDEVGFCGLTSTFRRVGK